MAKENQLLFANVCRTYRNMGRDYMMFLDLFYPDGGKEHPRDVDSMEDFAGELESIFMQSEEVIENLSRVEAEKLEDLDDFTAYNAIQEKTTEVRRDVLSKFAEVCMKNFDQLDAFAQRSICGMSIYLEVQKQQG